MNHLTARRHPRWLRWLAAGPVALLASAALGAGQPPQPGEAATFSVLLRGVRVGVETIAITHTQAGWLIAATGRQAAPVDLTTTKFEMTYGPDWQPERLAIEALTHGELLTLTTTFGPTTAVNDVLRGGQKSTVTHQVSSRAVVLPTNFFGAYAALAARLGAAAVGSTLPIYLAPQAEITAAVNRMTPKRMVTPGGTIDVRAYDLTFNDPAGPLAVEVWVDSQDHLVRLAIPAASLAVVRDDISSVMAREEVIRNAGDEDTFIPAAGFNLAATITKPAASGGRVPAVVLVPGSGPEDRDQTKSGVPVFGQLAGAIARAGFLAVRYDRRGAGQSGGRTEAATLADYADDVVHVIDWLRDRKDVADDRIAIVGYGEGAAVALLVASRGHNVAAVGLLAAAGGTGRELTLWQQEHALAKLKLSDADRQAKILLEQRLLNAVVTGNGWNDIPAELRVRADTPWFRSWLLFDPARTMRDVDQPVLVLHGSLDMEVPADQADRLEASARARKKGPDLTRKVVVAGVNHLLVPAATGEPEEYATLSSRTLSPDVEAALTTWLRDVLAARKK